MTSHLRSASHQSHHTVDVNFSSLALVQAPWEPHTVLWMPSFRPTPEQQIHIRVLFHFQWRIPALL